MSVASSFGCNFSHQKPVLGALQELCLGQKQQWDHWKALLGPCCGARQGDCPKSWADALLSLIMCRIGFPPLLLPWDGWHLKKKKKWRGERKKPATQAVKPWPCKEKACAGLCKQSVVCQGWPGRASWAMSRAQFPSHCGGCPRAHSPLLMWTTGSGWEDAPCPQSETTTTFPAGWAINHTKCFIKLWVPVRPPRTGQEEGSSDERTGFAELSQI